MRKYRIELSPEALKDFVEIHDSITEGLGEYWANLTLKRIKSDIERISISPLGYSRVDDKIDARRMKSGKYVVIYKVYEKQRAVVITHVFYARRDYLSILRREYGK